MGAAQTKDWLRDVSIPSLKDKSYTFWMQLHTRPGGLHYKHYRQTTDKKVEKIICCCQV